MLLTVLDVIFIGIFCVQLGYWLFLFGAFSFKKEQAASLKEQPVSVIIAAKNEAENLRENLPLLLEQQRSTYELVVVSDASIDSTVDVVRNLQKNHSQLKLIELANTADYQGRKKQALTEGIQEASHKNMLFIDADCRPVTPYWIQKMTSLLHGETAVVLGYGAYKKLPGFLNKLIRYETLLTALQYFSYALRGVPYMGVGRNLAYKKELFYQVNGFEGHRELLSGDDDLFINQVATKENSRICFSKESFTESSPKTSFTSWFRQKRRHISTANSYQPIHKFLLGTFYLSQLLFWLLGIAVLSFSLNWQLVILLILIRQIVQFMILSKAATKLNESDLIRWIPFLELTLIGVQLILFVVHLIRKPKHW